MRMLCGVANDLPKILCELIGMGSVRTEGEVRIWELRDADAVEVLTALLPHLEIERKQARLILDYAFGERDPGTVDRLVKLSAHYAGETC
ncbi:MAG: hypothetical protein L0099_07320 [Acidobacteria bacterium]|nr:hypothetical protein [Acidobacteriota bacterium]